SLWLAQAGSARIPDRRRRGAGAQAAEVPLSRAHHRCRHHAHRFSAAADALSRQLVSGRVGPRSRGAAQFRGGSHHRTGTTGNRRGRPRQRRTGRGARVQLWHLRGRAESLGHDQVFRTRGALGRGRALAFAAGRPVPARRPLRIARAVFQFARAADGRDEVRAGRRSRRAAAAARGNEDTLEAGVGWIFRQRVSANHNAVKFAYAATSHFGPTSAKFTWMRVCAPAPSALTTTPSPEWACRTRWPSFTGKDSSASV